MSLDESELSQADVFSLLSSARRRYVIYVLRRADEPMAVSDLAERVAAWENDVSVDELDSQERKRVYVSLYQTHVPKLADAGIVEYHSDSGLVVLTERASEMDQYLTDGDGNESFPWPYLYLPMALLGGVVTVLTALDVSVFVDVSELLVAGVVLCGFLVTVGVHLLYLYRKETPIPSELARLE